MSHTVLVSAIFSYSNTANFTIDSQSQFSGAYATLADQRDTSVSFHAPYDYSSVNAAYASGSVAGSAVGSVTVSSGKLDLFTSAIKYVTYDANANADSQQSGCVRFKYTPNYTTAPSGTVQIFLITNSVSSTANEIQVFHASTGILSLVIKNSAGTNVVALSTAWNPTSGTEYEFEINFDLTTGETNLYIDGNPLYTTSTATGTRDGNINILRIGSGYSATQIANFKLDDFSYFITPQHTASFSSPVSVVSTRYPLTNPVVVDATGITTELITSFSASTVVTGSDDIRFNLIVNSTAVYYNSACAAWITAATGYSEANPASDINSFVSALSLDSSSGSLVQVNAYLHAGDGTTAPQLNNVTMNYDFRALSPSAVQHCWVYGFLKDIAGEEITTATVTVKLNERLTFDGTSIGPSEKSVGMDARGGFEIAVIETQTNSATVTITLQYDQNGTTKKLTFGNVIIPNTATKSFNDLSGVS